VLVLLGLTLLNGPVARLAASYGSTFRLLTPGFTDLASLLAAGAVLGLAGAWLAAARHLARIEPRA
jgi:cell division transport system permease protein